MAGAVPKLVSSTDFLALVLAGSVERVQGAIDSGFDVNCPDDDLYTPLHKLMEAYVPATHLRVARLLLQQGAELDASQPGTDGWTPLHLAAWAGNVHAVQFLLDAGANPTLADWYGQTPQLVAKTAPACSPELLRALEGHTNPGDLPSYGSSQIVSAKDSGSVPCRYTRAHCPCGTGFLLHPEPCTTSRL